MFGGAEFVTSHFLDNYNYNLGEAYLSGPLFSKKKRDPNDSTKTIKEPIVGYFVSASGTYFEDPITSPLGYYKAPDDLRDQYLNAPYTFNNGQGTGGFITTPTADFYRKSDYDKIYTAENAAQKRVTAQGKIDIKPSKAINITIGGTLRLCSPKIIFFI